MWCVVHTLPHQEMRAEGNLLRQGFRSWLPTMLRTRRHARRLETIRAPIFPGYLFVELDPEREAWGRINGSFGVRRLITDGARPKALPQHFVETLQSELSSEGICMPSSHLEPGAEVRVVSGPFADMLATVVELVPGERVRLLLNLLGGQVPTTVSRHAVLSAA